MRILFVTALFCFALTPLIAQDRSAQTGPYGHGQALFTSASGVPESDSTKDATNEPDAPRGEASNAIATGVTVPIPLTPDSNRNIYYKHKLEWSVEGGWLPINIPFPLDPLEGDVYHTYPLKYTLVPVFASVRWQLSDIDGPGVFRGNWDLTSTVSATAIPRGPESRYFSYIMGIRRNMVPYNWPIAGYFDFQLGMGNIDAKGPAGVRYAQGQDFTFTANAGSGLRYNFSPRYAIAAGLHYMHISNANLSGSDKNYGLNVFGPMVGFYMQLPRSRKQTASQ